MPVLCNSTSSFLSASSTINRTSYICSAAGKRVAINALKRCGYLESFKDSITCHPRDFLLLCILSIVKFLIISVPTVDMPHSRTVALTFLSVTAACKAYKID